VLVSFFSKREKTCDSIERKRKSKRYGLGYQEEKEELERRIGKKNNRVTIL
jgi:hypothetical protein